MMFESAIIYARVPAADDGFTPNSVPAKVLALVHRGWQVLDVGCGGGHLAKHLTLRGAVVTGIERNAQAAALAREHCARVIEKDLGDPDVLGPNETYDAIVCADVLEHLDRPDSALERLAAHLRPGGLMIVSLPNIAHYKIRLRLLAGRFDYEPSGIMDRTHLRFFTRTTARRLLESAGLQVRSIDAVYGVPFGRLERVWRGMPRAVGGLAPALFAFQWVICAERGELPST